MNRTEWFRVSVKSEGSALIMVLWALALIIFLAGDYLEHNRGKASLAENAWQSLKQREAVSSVLNLFASDVWPISGQEKNQGTWIFMSPCGIDLWVKVDDESGRVNINTGDDNKIREKIRQVLGEGRADESDQIADAVLDWRDADDLVRTNGAETGYYESNGLAYGPANGSFKVLTELLLAKGVSSDLFWGDPMSSLPSRDEQEAQPIPVSLAEAFTIYGSRAKRVSILVPGKQKGYTFVMAFLEKKVGKWEMIQLYRNMRFISGEKTPAQLETAVELS